MNDAHDEAPKEASRGMTSGESYGAFVEPGLYTAPGNEKVDEVLTR
jgi:hypothetical protein